MEFANPAVMGALSGLSTGFNSLAAALATMDISKIDSFGKAITGVGALGLTAAGGFMAVKGIASLLAAGTALLTAAGALEAAAISEMADNTRDEAGFRVPEVDWKRTSKRVLTLEWIDGTPIADIAALDAKGFDKKALGLTVIRSFLRHAMRDGFFHAKGV